MQIRLHRLIHQAVKPAQQQPVMGKEQVVPASNPLFKDKLDMSSLASVASGIPAIALLGDRPAIKTEGLIIPLSQDLKIQRGRFSRDEVDIRNWNGDIRIDRPGEHQDETIRQWGQRIDLERRDWNQTISAA